MKEITLKAKLMKLEPKIEMAKKYDEYINNKIQQQQFITYRKNCYKIEKENFITNTR